MNGSIKKGSKGQPRSESKEDIDKHYLKVSSKQRWEALMRKYPRD